LGVGKSKKKKKTSRGLTQNVGHKTWTIIFGKGEDMEGAKGEWAPEQWTPKSEIATTVGGCSPEKHGGGRWKPIATDRKGCKSSQKERD